MNKKKTTENLNSDTSTGSVTIWIKDERSFLTFYNKPKFSNVIRECVFWREQKDSSGKFTGKVEIKLANPFDPEIQEIIEEISKIKD